MAAPPPEKSTCAEYVEDKSATTLRQWSGRLATPGHATHPLEDRRSMRAARPWQARRGAICRPRILPPRLERRIARRREVLFNGIGRSPRDWTCRERTKYGCRKWTGP